MSTLTNKLDCHGGESFARLAMTSWRDFTEVASTYKLINFSTQWKFRSLAARQLGGLKRRLSRSFACADFINPLNFQASKLLNFRKRFAFAPAFTMAEILISLTIIGVIAAITLPALQANINEKTWATQRKALYSRMSQAISMMPSLNGYGEFVLADPEHEIEGKDTVAMSFVTNGLSKVLELKNICDNQNLGKCGLPDKIKAKTGTIYSTKPNGTNPLTTLVQLNPKFHGSWTWTDGGNVYNQTYNGGNINNFAAAGFETKNGESVIAFYNPYCIDYEAAKVSNDTWINGYQLRPMRLMCANFVFDLNGKKGPNTVGKDIGVMSVLYPTDSEVVIPVIAKKSAASSFINNNGVHSASKFCKSLGDYRLPTREEVMSLFYNEYLLLKYVDYANVWSNERYGNTGAYILRFHTARYHAWDVKTTGTTFCVKK